MIWIVPLAIVALAVLASLATYLDERHRQREREAARRDALRAAALRSQGRLP